MVSSIIAILIALLWPSPDNLTPVVAVEAALAIVTYHPTQRCCGQCKDGVVTHGDGHITVCPCSDDCKCKAKTTTHPPSVLHPCPSGQCKLKPSK